MVVKTSSNMLLRMLDVPRLQLALLGDIMAICRAHAIMSLNFMKTSNTATLNPYLTSLHAEYDYHALPIAEGRLLLHIHYVGGAPQLPALVFGHVLPTST